MHSDAQAPFVIARKKQMVTELLDRLCQQLEISETQYRTATARYEAVGLWLAKSTSQHLRQAQIYPQGSIALGTTVKPIGHNEFDVDLVCHLPTLSDGSDPHAVKAVIGARLKENATYQAMLEEKRRCWRLRYANEFHLDITPSISNSRCRQGGELVPDKVATHWKPTNPKGYINRFEQYAALMPQLPISALTFGEVRADVEPLPGQVMTKPPLKRIVQLLKRHRDQMFVSTVREALAPISVIITTLTSWAYARCSTQHSYTDAFDFITAVIHEMPAFIKIENRLGRPSFIIENETTTGENFAEKWNSDPRLATSFYEWHSDVLASVESLLQIEGVYRFAEALSSKFGAKKEQVHEIFASTAASINHARNTGSLAVAPSVGLVTVPVSGSVAVPKNTFFGR